MAHKQPVPPGCREPGSAEGQPRLVTSHGVEDPRHRRLTFQKQKRGWEGSGPGDVLASRHLCQRVPPVVRGDTAGLPPSAGSLAPNPLSPRPSIPGPECATPSLQTALGRVHIRCTREVSGSPNAHPCGREGDGRPRRGERRREEPGAGALCARRRHCGPKGRGHQDFRPGAHGRFLPAVIRK